MNGPIDVRSPSALRQIVEVSIRLLVIAVFILWSFRLVAPFINPIVWAAVIAVAVYPVFVRVAAWLGGRRKLAVTLLILLALAVILVPAILMTTSLLSSTHALAQQVTDGTLKVPPPPDKIKDWPLVGDRVHGAWQQASGNLEAFLAHYQPQLQNLGETILAGVAGAGITILLLILSILIAGLFLVKADSCLEGMTRLTTRLAGKEKGEAVLTLAASTVRSVAVGVLGVAFIQATLAAVGMLFAGVPAIGIWALAVLLLAIMQLPPLLILLPVALWVFGSTDSQFTAWAFLVYSLLVSFSDSLLKPLLLGRGADVPMLVVLLGAIGGMIHGGILGLFVGAVVLAVGYQLLMVWLDMESEPKVSADPIEAG